MRSPKATVRYKVSTPLPGVKLEDHPGSTLRDPTGTLVELPADAVLEVEGAVAPSGLINVIWNGEAFSVFHGDLQEKAHLLTPANKR